MTSNRTSQPERSLRIICHISLGSNAFVRRERNPEGSAAHPSGSVALSKTPAGRLPYATSAWFATPQGGALPRT